jgi:hypothetical protein
MCLFMNIQKLKIFGDLVPDGVRKIRKVFFPRKHSILLHDVLSAFHDTNKRALQK